MLTFLSSLIPCISARHEPDQPRLAASSIAATKLHALGNACGLSQKGTQALVNWTCWIAYADTQARDPHILEVPGWGTLLPLDIAHAQEHLYRVLLRAGESRETALKTAMKCYPDRGGLYAEPPLPKPLRGLADGMAAFKAEDLPSNAVPYESLPNWAREIAVYATDLTGKSLAGLTSIAGLDLRWLNLYCADLSDLDMQNCDCMNADMRGAHIRNANIDRARMDPSIGSRVNGKVIRSYAPAAQGDTPRGNVFLREGKVDFFHDREILDIFPVQRTERVGGVNIGYLEDRRSVIQQQAQRGCSAGVSTMLSADHGGRINVYRLRSRSLADDAAQVLSNLKDATDYTPFTARPRTVEALAEQLDKYGSAIVSVNGEIGTHLIIVDEIDLNAYTVALRDPYHGWAIRVPLVAFTSRWAPDSEDRIVQLWAPDAQASQPPPLWA